MKYLINDTEEKLTKEQWKEKILCEIDDILEYQELSRYSYGEDGKQYYMEMEIKLSPVEE